jgi:hypothetical protein
MTMVLPAVSDVVSPLSPNCGCLTCRQLLPWCTSPHERDAFRVQGVPTEALPDLAAEDGSTLVFDTCFRIVLGGAL